MTEAEWLACDNPLEMLEFMAPGLLWDEYQCSNADATPVRQFLRGKVTDRKLRLFACACCRSAWHLISELSQQSAVEVAERFADSLATLDELSGGNAAAWNAYLRLHETGREDEEHEIQVLAALAAFGAASHPHDHLAPPPRT